MSLSELIAGVAAAEKTLTVFNPAGDVADRLTEHFADRNVFVTTASHDLGPTNYVVLGEGRRFLTAVNVDELLDPTTEFRPGFETNTYRPILDHLDETLFRSFDRARMLAATREIEDRAWRVGAGQLHAGFQNAGNLDSQLTAYERLGERDDLSVHAYIYPSGTVPKVERFLLHLARTEEIELSWFVVYDGNGIDDYKCALLAEEDPLGGFSGFWTYDPSTVDYLVNYLQSTYAIVKSDGDGFDGASRSVSNELRFPAHIPQYSA